MSGAGLTRRFAVLACAAAAASLATLAGAPAVFAAVTDVDVENGTLLAAHFNSPFLGGSTVAIRSSSIFQPVNDLRIVIDAVGQTVTVIDITSGARVVPGEGCQLVVGSPDRVTCGGFFNSVFVDAGPGDDHVINLTPLSSFMRGQLGDDTLTGGPFLDDLRGGDGRDLLRGEGGLDYLDGDSGPDELHGDQDHDLLDGGDGDDVLHGEGGDDSLSGGFGADQMFGESGIDGVGYDDHTSGVTVVVDAHVGDGGLDDGPPGSVRDFVSQDVENVTGSNFDDELTGSAADNRLHGLANDGSVADEQGGLGRVRDDVHADVENLIGTAAGDVLIGNGAANRLEGRDGADVLNGELGNDTIDAAGDGVADQIACGAGTDAARLDLVDVPVGTDVAPEPADCEDIERAALGEHPTVAIAPRARIAHGLLAVRLACPRGARAPGCRGHLTIRGRRTALATTSYATSPGTSEALRLPLRFAPARRAVLRAIASERDPSGRPKLTVRVLRVLGRG